MHNRLKVLTTEEQKLKKAKEHAAKMKIYQETMKKIFELRKTDESTPEELLKLTESLLIYNPDINTLWNMRREILLKEKNQIKQSEVDSELYLTEICLKVNPKSYSAWHHRQWVLCNCPEPNWDKEIDLCSKYLMLDERNFHCWDHRNFMVQKANSRSNEQELKFTEEKISQNFSNYSAWHYRSKLLNQFLSDNNEIFKDELNLVQNAIFTDPNDSSAWFYQRWLLIGQNKYEDIKIVLAYIEKNKDENKLFLVLNKQITNNNYKLVVNDEHFKFTANENFTIEACLPNYLLNDTFVNLKLFINESILDSINLNFDSNLKRFQYETKSKLGVYFDKNAHEILIDQLMAWQELSQLEPNNKWIVLTSALLKRGIGGNNYQQESIDDINLLIKIDGYRQKYYADLKSKWIIENFLNDKIENSSLFDDLVLNDDNLTKIYYLPYFFGSQRAKINNISINEDLKIFAI